MKRAISPVQEEKREVVAIDRARFQSELERSRGVIFLFARRKEEACGKVLVTGRQCRSDRRKRWKIQRP